jgi:outer membrane immunogenic protein
VPINLLFAQVFKIGDQPMQFQVGPRYYVESPANGPRWGARFNLTFLFPAGGASPSAQAAAMPTKAPSASPPWSWTGFYLGPNAGYSSGQSDTNVAFVNAATGATAVPPASSITGRLPDLSGFFGGGQVGYNMQATNWVYGIEVDMQWANQKGSANYLCGAPAAIGVNAACLAGTTSFPVGAAGTSLATSQKLEWFGTARGRVGLLISPAALGYITGGLAFGSVNTTGTLSSFNLAQAPVATTFSGSRTNAGWTIGTGLEARLAGTNWTAKVEYLYIDLGKFNNSVAQAAATGVPIGANLSSRVTDNLIRVGGNYKF